MEGPPPITATGPKLRTGPNKPHTGFRETPALKPAHTPNRGIIKGTIQISAHPPKLQPSKPHRCAVNRGGSLEGKRLLADFKVAAGTGGAGDTDWGVRREAERVGVENAKQI